MLFFTVFIEEDFEVAYLVFGEFAPGGFEVMLACMFVDFDNSIGYCIMIDHVIDG